MLFCIHMFHSFIDSFYSWLLVYTETMVIFERPFQCLQSFHIAVFLNQYHPTPQSHSARNLTVECEQWPSQL